ncbi:MAG: LptF/LptG family permease [Myxococcota bacterium]|nr:LptF/LptG family permease [Myxococcota bacterium]
MGVLARYFLTRFLATFAATLSILALAVFAVDLLAGFDEVIEGAHGLLGALTHVALRIPSYYMPSLVPLACFTAAFVGFGSAARRLEIVAVKAGGISPLRAVWPVLLAALAISGSALAFNETIAVQADRAWARLRADGADWTFRAGSFWYYAGDTVYNVRASDPTAGRLEDFAVYELDARGRLRRTIQARRAESRPEGGWRLVDAVIRRFDPDAPEVPPSYHEIAETEVGLAEREALYGARVSSLSAAHLRQYRDRRPPGDPEAVRADALLHERLSAPLLSFVFALLGVPLGLRVESSRGLARPALLGVAAIFAVFVVRQYAATLATQGVLHPTGTPWAVLAAFAAFGAWQLARVPR